MMKTHMTRYITTLIIFLCCIVAAGQNKCNITGTVVDTKGEAVSYASAVLYDDGKILTGGVTAIQANHSRFSLMHT